MLTSLLSLLLIINGVPMERFHKKQLVSSKQNLKGLILYQVLEDLWAIIRKKALHENRDVSKKSWLEEKGDVVGLVQSNDSPL